MYTTRCSYQMLKKICFHTFSKNTQTSYFMQVRPVGAEFFHEDRETDRRRVATKSTFAVHSFSKAPKRGQFLSRPPPSSRKVSNEGCSVSTRRRPHFKVFMICTEILLFYVKEYMRLSAHIEPIFLHIYKSGNISNMNCRENIHLMSKTAFPLWKIIKQSRRNITEFPTLPRTWTIWRSYLREERTFEDRSHKALPWCSIWRYLNTINTLLPF